jgi:putative endonuclease
MYYVYFLRLNNEDIYTGYTENLKRRIEEHKLGKVKSTRHRKPIILIGYEAYRLKNDAARRERFLKTTEGRRLFRQQYRDILRGSPGHSTGRGVE